jgi:hypothetical protein
MQLSNLNDFDYIPIEKNLNINSARLIHKYKSEGKKSNTNGANDKLRAKVLNDSPFPNFSCQINLKPKGLNASTLSPSEVPIFQSSNRIQYSSRLSDSMKASKRVNDQTVLPVIDFQKEIDKGEESKALTVRIKKKKVPSTMINNYQVDKMINGSDLFPSNIYERGNINVSIIKSSKKEKNNFLKFHRLFELWIDIEFNIEKKGNTINLIKKYFEVLEEETKDYTEDDNIIYFFSNSKLNQFYTRIKKLKILVLSTLLILLSNFYTESHMKLQIRRIVTGISNPLYAFYDNFIMQEGYLSRDYMDKLDLLRKCQKIQFKDKGEALTLLEKNVDVAIWLLKQFSCVLIKNSLIKQYYTILNDLLKNIDKVNLMNLITLVTKCTSYSILKRVTL